MHNRLFRFFLLLLALPLSAVSPEERKREAEKRITANAGDFRAVFNLAYANFQLNDYKASLEGFQRALLLAPDHKSKAMVRYNMGNVLFMQKKIEEAIRQYRIGLRFTPDDRALQYNFTIARMIKKGKSNQKQNKRDKQDREKKEKRSGKKGESAGQQGDTPQKAARKRTGVMKKEDARRILQALKQRESKRIKARVFKAKKQSSSVNRKEW